VTTSALPNWIYHRDGQLIQTTDADANIIRYTYDGDGRQLTTAAEEKEIGGRRLSLLSKCPGTWKPGGDCH
jgi:YD repeat-containing protein